MLLHIVMLARAYPEYAPTPNKPWVTMTDERDSV